MGQFWGLSGSYQSTQTISNTLFGGFYQLYSDGANWVFLALAAYGFDGELSSPVALRAPSLRINNSDITTIFAPRASPTFTGTATADTITATGVGGVVSSGDVYINTSGYGRVIGGNQAHARILRGDATGNGTYAINAGPCSTWGDFTGIW